MDGTGACVCTAQVRDGERERSRQHRRLCTLFLGAPPFCPRVHRSPCGRQVLFVCVRGKARLVAGSYIERKNALPVGWRMYLYHKEYYSFDPVDRTLTIRESRNTRHETRDTKHEARNTKHVFDASYKSIERVRIVPSIGGRSLVRRTQLMFLRPTCSSDSFKNLQKNTSNRSLPCYVWPGAAAYCQSCPRCPDSRAMAGTLMVRQTSDGVSPQAGR